MIALATRSICKSYKKTARLVGAPRRKVHIRRLASRFRESISKAFGIFLPLTLAKDFSGFISPSRALLSLCVLLDFVFRHWSLLVASDSGFALAALEKVAHSPSFCYLLSDVGG